MPSASLSRRSLTSRRRSRPTASSRPLSPSTWPRSRSPHETPHGSGRVAFRARFAIRPPRVGHRRINARFPDNDHHAKWLAAFQHGISSILHGLGTHRPPVPGERPVTRVWRPRDLRARRPNGMAHPPTGPDPHRHGRIRMGAAMGWSSRRNPAGRCCLDPAGSEALAWSHSSHGRDPYRHSGTARREGRRVAGTGQRRTISGALKMPHVIVKLWPGKSEQQKRRLAEAITQDVMKVLNYGDEAVGSGVRTLKVGDVVVMPFAFSDGTCVFCHEGLHTSCIHGGFFGTVEVAGAQAEAVRVPQADGTLVVLPVGADDALMPSLLTLSDVMGTGHHAARAAKVGRGKTVAVIGDGAVGLWSVIATRRLGAERIIFLGRHPDRIALAQTFGATDIVSERGEEAVARVRALNGGFGVHSVLECVGTDQAMRTAIGIVRPGGAVGRVGVPHYEAIPASEPAFYNNVTISGGPAP